MMQTPLIFASTIIISSLTFFNLGVNGMFVNRTFLNLPLSLIEAHVLKVPLEENESLLNYYFDEENIKTNVKKYLSANLKNHINSYSIGFKFYQLDDSPLYETSYNDGLLMRFKANYYQNFEFDASLSFHIEQKIGVMSINE